jgi:hypothetical protein
VFYLDVKYTCMALEKISWFVEEMRDKAETGDIQN